MSAIHQTSPPLTPPQLPLPQSILSTAKNNANNSKSSPTTKSAAHYAFPISDCIIEVSEAAAAAKQKKHSQQKSLRALFPIRYLVLGLSLACLSLLVANSLALNFTVICMQKERTATTTTTTRTTMPFSPNVTLPIEEEGEEAMFTLTEQGWLFAAIAIGMLLGTLPITQIYTHFGMRKMFTIYGLVNAFGTLLIPASIYLAGFPALLAMRILQGFGMSSMWVATGAVSAEWCPMSSSGIFLSVLTANYQFGPITAMPLGAAFCSSPTLGWPSVYYLLGVVSVGTFSLFFWFYRDSPRQQKLVSPQELQIIEEGRCPNEAEGSRQRRGGHSQQQQAKIPYRAILTDPVFWGVFSCTASSNLGFQVFWQFGPIYLNKTLGMEVAKTGLAAALPYILSAITKISAGQISDRLVAVSQRAKVIFFASTSQYMMAGCFLVMALLPKIGFTTHVTAMQCMFTAATVFSGLNAVGVTKSVHLISGQFSHVLFSWNTLMLSLIMLTLPIAISQLTPTNSVDEWADVFLFVTCCVLAGTTFFNFYAQVEPREWTKTTSSKTSVASFSTFHGTTICAEEGKQLGAALVAAQFSK